MAEPIVARTCMHTTYVPDTGNGTDAVVVSEIVEYPSGRTEPKLRIFRSPKVSFWVTQSQYRNHTDKKEFESLSKLDEFIVPYKDKEKEMFRHLNGYYPNFLTRNQKREVQRSPYLYGGNITAEAFVGMKYKRDLEKVGKIAHSPTTGFFDIEQSLLPESLGMLPLLSFTAENKVYLAMKDSFMWEERDGKHVRVTVDDIKQAITDYIDPLVESIFTDNAATLGQAKEKLPFTYELFVGNTEVEMIRWIFKKIHESKVTFIGIWNLGYDIPEIIKILEREGIPLSEIFCDPSLQGTGFDYVSYREDKRDVAHYTQKWHWLTASAYCQFVDSMALYSYTRIVDGKEASYALDDILKKYNLGGKLKIDKTNELEGLQQGDWHRAMLSRFFTYYAVYAMWDTMSLQIMEWRNTDLTSMRLAADVTPPKFFPNQTIKATNTLFEDWKPIS